CRARPNRRQFAYIKTRPRANLRFRDLPAAILPAPGPDRHQFARLYDGAGDRLAGGRAPGAWSSDTLGRLPSIIAASIFTIALSWDRRKLICGTSGPTNQSSVSPPAPVNGAMLVARKGRNKGEGRALDGTARMGGGAGQKPVRRPRRH